MAEYPRNTFKSNSKIKVYMDQIVQIQQNVLYDHVKCKQKIRKREEASLSEDSMYNLQQSLYKVITNNLGKS